MPAHQPSSNHGARNGYAAGASATRAGARQAAGQLKRALLARIDAAIAAEQYASTKELPVRFGSEDLRAMALSLR
ncbi:MAG: hypothetical protein FJW37_09480 [Acidobacteria bacterium]|nr:hypothetical protein [Acidobacteriota bacterium]